MIKDGAVGYQPGAMRSAIRSISRASLPLVAILLLASVGCEQMGALKAKKAFKEANQAYQQQDFKKAAQLYEEVVADDPTMSEAYFYLANSYDNQYKPSRKGEPDNDAFLQKAVDNYQKAADKLTMDNPQDAKLKRYSLAYLAAAYGVDKLNDPAKAEPVVQGMIKLDPSEPANYFQLAKIYEDAGAYEQAELVLLKAKDAKPNDPAVYTTLAGYYNRQGQFNKTIAALEERATKEPNNPDAFQTIAVYYWDESYRDSRLKEQEKKDFVNKGIQAVDQALKIKPDYVDALVYKNLLLRLEANLEKDPKKQQELIKEADQLRDKAVELRKQKAGGVGQ